MTTGSQVRVLPYAKVNSFPLAHTLLSARSYIHSFGACVSMKYRPYLPPTDYLPCAWTVRARCVRLKYTFYVLSILSFSMDDKAAEGYLVPKGISHVWLCVRD